MKYNNILLIRTDRIGDVILTTPAISILKTHYPKANIYFLTRRYTAPILQYYEGLKDVMIYRSDDLLKGIKGIQKLADEIRDKEIDIAFMFYPQFKIAFALRMAGVNIRVGSGYRWFSFLLNHRVYEHRKHGQRHELEYNLSLIKDFIPQIPQPQDIHFNFHVNKRLKAIQQRALDNLKISDKYIIVHPGSGGSAPNLSPSTFGEIIKYLLSKSSIKILLVGNRSEISLLDEVANRVKNPHLIQIRGNWDLETYMALIAGCQLFISNSTGPLHIARALEVPLIAFYCPAVPCSPRRWGPYNRIEAVLQPDIKPCKSCNRNKCPHGNCLDFIEWGEIEKALDSNLKAILSD